MPDGIARQWARESYTREQVDAIEWRLEVRTMISVELCYWCGLDDVDLITLMPGRRIPRLEARAEEEKAPPLARFLHEGREGVLCAARGRSGRLRKIIVPDWLSVALARTLLPKPRDSRNQGKHYLKHYEISCGWCFVRAFTTASARELGWTEGIRGLRNSYRVRRLGELEALGHSEAESAGIISLELGEDPNGAAGGRRQD